jgi:hypothetical protein
MGDATAKKLAAIIGGREYRETTAAATLALMGNLAAFFPAAAINSSRRQPEARPARAERDRKTQKQGRDIHHSNLLPEGPLSN